MAKVDCTEGGKDICGKFSVSGYPTLKIFKNGEFSQDYNGPREAGNFIFIIILKLFIFFEVLNSVFINDYNGKVKEGTYVGNS